MGTGIVARFFAWRGISLISTVQLEQQKAQLSDLSAQLQRQSEKIEDQAGELRRQAELLETERSKSERFHPQANDDAAAEPAAKALFSDVEHVLFKDLPKEAHRDIQFFDRLYKFHGPLRSTSHFSNQSKLDAELHFHFREKAEVALTACSSWYGGDYFEFGSGDLNTFRNMLTAYDICGMTKAYTDVRFYAFDIFGDLTVGAPPNENAAADYEQYFTPYTQNGDQLALHREYVAQHNLFVDKCFLIQGLFQYTLTEAFKKKYKAERRSIGFAFLDCNMGSSYKTVFEYIFDMMAPSSYIYMDEYLQNPAVVENFGHFQAELRRQRRIGCVYVRNAGGFGGLFRLYPLGQHVEAGQELTLTVD